MTAAIVSEALRTVGCRTMLVGGGALEFYAPDAYLTRDVDLVVEDPTGQPVRERLATTFDALGFTKLSGRHWERGGLLIEVPGHRIDDPFIEVDVGPYHLNVIRLEVVLVGRRRTIFKSWNDNSSRWRYDGLNLHSSSRPLGSCRPPNCMGAASGRCADREADD